METLFGDDPDAHVPRKGGHPHAPGTGPEGETCGTCQHYTRVYYHDKVYRKCGLMTAHWTHGYGTDIRKRDSACRCWETVDEPT